MRLLKTSVTLAAAFVSLGVGSARAQDDAIVAKIPFPFMVQADTFPAGRYSISDVGGVLTIRGIDNDLASRVLTIPAGGVDPADNEPVLAFTPSENSYRLTEIWMSSDEGFSVPLPDAPPQVGRAQVGAGTPESRPVVIVRTARRD